MESTRDYDADTYKGILCQIEDLTRAQKNLINAFDHQGQDEAMGLCDIIRTKLKTLQDFKPSSDPTHKLRDLTHLAYIASLHSDGIGKPLGQGRHRDLIMRKISSLKARNNS